MLNILYVSGCIRQTFARSVRLKEFEDTFTVFQPWPDYEVFSSSFMIIKSIISLIPVIKTKCPLCCSFSLQSNREIIKAPEKMVTNLKYFSIKLNTHEIYKQQSKFKRKKVRTKFIVVIN